MTSIGEGNSNALTVEGLAASYAGQPALSNATFALESGTITGVLGPNGAGKSTLIKALVGMVKVDSGSVDFGGKTLKQTRSSIAYIPQRKDIDWTFPINVLDTVLAGTYPKLGLVRRAKKADREWARECLRMVGAADLADRHIGELSGGQQQRIFIARALAQRADYIFLDEPLTGIDAVSQETICTVLIGLKAEGATILMVHHDVVAANDLFDHVLLVNKTVTAAGSPRDLLTQAQLASTYGIGRLGAGLEPAFGTGAVDA